MLALTIAGLVFKSQAAKIEPELVAPNEISTELDEFGMDLGRDGKSCLFCVSVPHSNMYVVCSSADKGGHWSTPRVVPWSGLGRDSDPVFSPDRNKTFFVSDRPTSTGGPRKSDYDAWVVDRMGAGWGQPRRLPPPVNSDTKEFFVSSTATGTLYVTSERGRPGAAQLYSVPYDGKRYGKAELLGPEINGEGVVTDCEIAPDESFMICAIYGRRDSYGGLDLYASFRDNGKWTPVKNLGPEINGPVREYSPRISPDGNWLYYSSERGFLSKRSARKRTLDDLEAGGRSVLNGYGNIYRVDLHAVLARAKGVG